MRTPLLFIIFFLALSFGIGVFAEGDMTSTGFIINLGHIDPLAETRTGGGATGMQGLFYILEGVSRMLLFTIPIIAIISTIVAGYYYIFSAGDSEKANKAKTIIKWNIIAIFVALMSWSIIQLIASIFSN